MDATVAAAFAQVKPLAFLDSALFLISLVLQAALLFLAVRLYRSRPQPPLPLLVWACVFYVFPQAVRLVLVGISLARHHEHLQTPVWYSLFRDLYLVLFALLMIGVVRFYIRGRVASVSTDI